MPERRDRVKTGLFGIYRKALLRIKAGIARLGLCPRRVQSALILAGVGALYALETQTLGLFVPCPLHLLTGLKCPACGITTAILALLHGDVGAVRSACRCWGRIFAGCSGAGCGSAPPGAAR